MNGNAPAYIDEYMEQRRKTDLPFAAYKNLFYDEFGNRGNDFIIERFEKRSDEKWHKVSERSTHGSDTYVVDGKIYWLFPNDETLIAMNMDPDSPTCHAYERVKCPDPEVYVKITGNTTLYEQFRPQYYRLNRQDCSDGTCFYALYDKQNAKPGDFRVDFGSEDLGEIVSTLQGIADAYDQDARHERAYDLKKIYEEAKARYDTLIEKLKAVQELENTSKAE